MTANAATPDGLCPPIHPTRRGRFDRRPATLRRARQRSSTRDRLQAAVRVYRLPYCFGLQGSWAKKAVGRAPNCSWAAVEDVGVDLRRRDVAMPEQFLDRPDVVVVLQEVCGERVAERMGARPLGDAGLP